MRARLLVAALGLCLVSGLAVADAPAQRAEPLASIGGVDQVLVALEAEERTVRAELETLTPRIEGARKRAAVRGRALYRLVRAGLLPVGGGFGALFEHAIRVERVRRGVDEDVRELDAASTRKTELMHRLEAIATRRAPLELEQQAATRARAVLEEAEDRRLSFERAFQSKGAGNGDYVAVYGGAGPIDPAAAGDPFRAQKGRLPFPIAGRTEISRVRRGGAEGPGLELRAAPGTAVRAVHGGRVAFADRYASFGKVVIIDHGDGFFTLLGNLATVDARQGDSVAAGARVGTVGDDGKGPMVYFEVRHSGATLDPGPWLGL